MEPLVDLQAYTSLLLGKLCYFVLSFLAGNQPCLSRSILDSHKPLVVCVVKFLNVRLLLQDIL